MDSLAACPYAVGCERCRVGATLLCTAMGRVLDIVLAIGKPAGPPRANKAGLGSAGKGNRSDLAVAIIANFLVVVTNGTVGV